jgi:hypothetical protein
MFEAMIRPAIAITLLLGACATNTGPPAAAPPAVSRPVAAPGQPPPLLGADSLAEHEIAPGVVHRYLWSAAGPWAVHIVEAAPGACRAEVRTRKAGGAVVGRALTSALAAEAEAEFGRPVLAAVNADFFAFDPPGVPVGAQVAAGAVVRGPGARPVFGVTAGGAPFIAVIELAAVVETAAGMRAPIGEVNTRPGADGITLYNEYAGGRTPADTGVIEVRIEPVHSVEGAGKGSVASEAGTSHGVVAVFDTMPEGIDLPAGGVVLAGRGRGAAFLRHLLAPGDTVAWSIGFAGAPGPVQELVGGHPQLLRGGEPVAASGAFATTRHPRSAVGWRGDGTLLLVVVDGRQGDYSVGMSLSELTELFRSLGAVEALNLDGGGSTTLVVGGAVANRPSDPQGERPVANALLLLGADGAGCGAR